MGEGEYALITYYPLAQLAVFVGAWCAGILTALLVGEVAK